MALLNGALSLPTSSFWSETRSFHRQGVVWADVLTVQTGLRNYRSRAFHEAAQSHSMANQKSHCWHYPSRECSKRSCSREWSLQSRPFSLIETLSNDQFTEKVSGLRVTILELAVGREACYQSSFVWTKRGWFVPPLSRCSIIPTRRSCWEFATPHCSTTMRPWMRSRNLRVQQEWVSFLNTFHNERMRTSRI